MINTRVKPQRPLPDSHMTQCACCQRRAPPRHGQTPHQETEEKINEGGKKERANKETQRGGVFFFLPPSFLLPPSPTHSSCNEGQIARGHSDVQTGEII